MVYPARTLEAVLQPIEEMRAELEVREQLRREQVAALEAENHQLRIRCAGLMGRGIAFHAEAARLRLEVERLQAELDAEGARVDGD